MDENLSTLSYASKASFISNKPVKNEDPKTAQITELKRQVKLLTEELANANETISFLTSLTKNNPQTISKNLIKFGDAKSSSENEKTFPLLKQSQRSAVLLKETSENEKNPEITEITTGEEIDRINSNRMETTGTIVTKSGLSNHAANETKEAITSRIIHTINMMKSVLRGNVGLRETIQKQSELIDEQNREMFQLHMENDDLRERLATFEEFTGKDSLAADPIDQVHQLKSEKKTLEDRVAYLENSGINWSTNAVRVPTASSNMRTTMTNFAFASKMKQMEEERQTPTLTSKEGSFRDF